MKNLRRIICFLMMIVSLSFFTACSKDQTPPPEIGTGTEQDGGSGDGSEESGGEEDNGDEQEVYVPYTSNEIMNAGSVLLSEFFNEYEADLTDEDLFDDNIDNIKMLFLNTSKMITAVSQIDNLPYGYCVRGNAEELVDYTGKPNKVERFDATFKAEDSNGNSSVKLKIVFSYNELDVDYTYDYYDILIKTNKSQKKVSCEILIERSSIKDSDDSTGRYFYVNLNGKIGGGFDDIKYNCYRFNRTQFINEYTAVNYNNIDQFEQSVFDGQTKTYVGVSESELLLRNSNSDVTKLVSSIVGAMNQGYKSIFNGGVLGTISSLSSSLIAYVNEVEEII